MLCPPGQPAPSLTWVNPARVPGSDLVGNAEVRLVAAEVDALAVHERERNLHLNMSALSDQFLLPNLADRKQKHHRAAAALLQQEFVGLHAASSLLYAEILLRSVQTFVHWAFELEERADRAALAHYDAFVAGYSDAVARTASSHSARPSADEQPYPDR